MTQNVKNRVIIFFSVIVVAVLFLLPTIFPQSLRDNWLSHPISLGLDLSGGVHLVYEVQAHEAVASRLQSSATAIRGDLRDEKVPVTRARVNDRSELEITLLTARFVDKAKKVIEDEYKDLRFKEQVSDGSRMRLIYDTPEQNAARIEREAVTQAIETLRNRVDQFGVAEPVIQKVGDKRILLQMPGVSDIEAVKKQVGRVARLEFRLLPVPGSTTDTITLKDRDGSPVEVEEEVLMTGDAVDHAMAEPFQGQIGVGLTLTSEGGKTFRKITSQNVGRYLAIVLDKVVYSSPEIREAIGGGRASISGGFTTLTEASQLAAVLRAGALPASFKVLEERTVGPTLGQESIERGVSAILIGFALIIVFMGFYYRLAGLVAVSTLVLNVLLVVAALSAFGATLTLPGLAGLALTIGMAVDANVIIFERIREELLVGSGRDAAVSAGFDKALSAIIDSNLTTLLAGLILYYFGTGPIRGFAVTLSIGIVTTIYCATFVSRLAFDVFSLKSKDELSI